MSTISRYLYAPIEEDLTKKMVFLGGPRQVGKTTLAHSLLHNFHDGHPAYLNWDALPDRKRIRTGDWPKNESLIVFDEIHKYARWRGLVKGYYDTLKNTHQFLITGSARLDYYRKSGDSLLGRYHYYRLHPLSLPELDYQDLPGLLQFGGFPEPYLGQNMRELKRWHINRGERILYNDVRELERIHEISLLSLLLAELPKKVGSLLSKKNLAEDLEIDFKTIERWLSILGNVYYCYRISPYGAPKVRALKKSQKLYLWDWSEVENKGAKWENLVASHLLKHCHFQQDYHGEKMELRFLRDTNKREIDFVVLKNGKATFAVECKFGEKNISPHLHYFQQRTDIPHFYQVHAGQAHKAISDNITLIPFSTFCQEIGIP